jgi:hypothetical protein
LFETFTKIATGSTEPNSPKKATLRFGDKTISFTVKNLNGFVPGDQIDGRDEAIVFDIEADYPLRQQYLDWNGLSDFQDQHNPSEECKITLLEYISYINSQYLRITT